MNPYSFQGKVYYDAVQHSDCDCDCDCVVLLIHHSIETPSKPTNGSSGTDILYLNNGPPYARDDTRICHVMPALLIPTSGHLFRHAISTNYSHH